MRGKRAPKKVACANASLGCNISVFPKDLEKHALVCLFQQVECEGCGETMLLRDQVTHQKVKRCIEKKVKNDRIWHAKKAHSDMMRHNQRMRSLKASIEVMNWQRLKGLVHEKHGWTPRVPNAWGEEFEQYSSQSPRLQRETSTPALTEGASERDLVDGLTGETEQEHFESNLKVDYAKTPTHSPRIEEIHENDLTTVEKGGSLKREKAVTPQVTFAEHDTDLEETSTIVPASSYESSKRAASARTPSLCVRCGKFFRLSSNNEHACQYHEGPILEVYRGMCAACGQLDYRPGCCKGPHVPLDISLEGRPHSPVKKHVVLRKQGSSPRTASPMFVLMGAKLSA